MPKAYTHKEFVDIVKAKHIWIKEVVGTYVNSRTPIEIECTNGHHHSYDPKKLTRAEGGTKHCLICEQEKYAETREQYGQNPKLCEWCGTPIPFSQNSYYTRKKRFCSQSCAASSLNQQKKKMLTNHCLSCGTLIADDRKYCSNNCQQAYQAKLTVEAWLNNEDSGTIDNGRLKSSVRNWVLQKANYQCEICGWHETNPTTGLVPIEIHHIDGDSTNNRPENLQVLCPNCHSLTSTFRALNVGQGRQNRPK